MTKNGKSANGKSAVQETKKMTDEQTDSQQICKCWDTLFGVDSIDGVKRCWDTHVDTLSTLGSLYSSTSIPPHRVVRDSGM
jgi:hypothetical protein